MENDIQGCYINIDQLNEKINNMKEELIAKDKLLNNQFSIKIPEIVYFFI